jgi:NADPH:quinone reductase-like Zn-dependent oxidoreductase
MKLPRIPCSDGAGEVVAVGAGVTAWKPGDRVAGIFMQNWLDGPLTQQSAWRSGRRHRRHADRLRRAQRAGTGCDSRHLSFQEAATLPCAAVTAWNALATGRAQAGIDGPDPGNGRRVDLCAAVCAAEGCAGAGHQLQLRKAGAGQRHGPGCGTELRDNPDWDRWALDQTGGEGVDLVVEVGGAGTLPRSLRAIRMGGTVAQVGVLTQELRTHSLPHPPQDGADSRHLRGLAQGLC